MAKRILIVEDQDFARRGIAAILEQDGHTAMHAKNALEAQALCTENPPDVAIVDIELPGLKGNEWALHLQETNPQTRIIFVSGRPSLPGLDRFGTDVHFLRKPFSPDMLLELVEEGQCIQMLNSE